MAPDTGSPKPTPDERKSNTTPVIRGLNIMQGGNEETVNH